MSPQIIAVSRQWILSQIESSADDTVAIPKHQCSYKNKRYIANAWVMEGVLKVVRDNTSAKTYGPGINFDDVQ